MCSCFLLFFKDILLCGFLIFIINNEYILYQLSYFKYLWPDTCFVLVNMP